MSDLIRRKDALEIVKRTGGDYATAFSEISKFPAVDAVEVVRCSQCVNNPRIGTKTKGMVWCRKFRSEVRPDDFCSYGERRKKCQD